MGFELAAVLAALALGVGSNLLVSLFRWPPPPLLSTVLVLPGIAAFVALSPRSETPFMEAAHRWKSRGYQVKAAFVTFEDGTLLGSRAAPGELAVDSGLFGSTLNAIQDFMRTSFPTQHGGWLRSITHGNYTLVLERGRSTCLTLVLHGKEDDQLRRLMRDALRTYERDNAAVLAHWRGVAAEATGTAAMLASLLEGGAEGARRPPRRRGRGTPAERGSRISTPGSAGWTRNPSATSPRGDVPSRTPRAYVLSRRIRFSTSRVPRPKLQDLRDGISSATTLRGTLRRLPD